VAEMRVELVAIEREIWSGVAKSVIARTVEGDIGVLPGHAPLLAQLKEGFSARIILQDGTEMPVALHGGFLSVTKEKVSILAEDAQLADEIDVNEARAVFTAAEADSDESLRAKAQLLAAGQSL